jgi:methylmalonyl-CoA epimerase
MTFDHVGIVVESIDGALPFYRDAMGLMVDHREEVSSQHVRVAFLKDPAAGRPQIELLEAIGQEGAVAKFLKSHGPGLHHVAFKTLDIEDSMRRFKAGGRPALEATPRLGARGHKVCFLHPKHAQGVLVELVG